MGPVIFITGNPRMRVRLPWLLLASMGPVIFITGNHQRYERHEGAGLASMGPVIFITGNLVTARKGISSLQLSLQWGR